MSESTGPTGTTDSTQWEATLEALANANRIALDTQEEVRELRRVVIVSLVLLATTVYMQTRT